jgi:hypothetical protein
VFDQLQEAAAEGKRCPTNHQIAERLAWRGLQIAPTSVPSVMKKLTSQGLIIVRIYGANWRDVIICSGPHSEKTTLPPPHGGKPHIVLRATGRE